MAAGEDVAPELRLAVEPSGERLHRLQVDETVAEFDRLRLGPGLHGRVRGQQETRTQLHQPGGHHHPVAFLAERRRRWRVLQGGRQLVDQSTKREPCQVDLMRPRQRQQPVQRPAEAVEVEDWRPLASPGGLVQPIGDDAVHVQRRQSNRRGCSRKCSAGQRAANVATAAVGVSSAVKNP